jgi:hypothetical protein
VTENVWIDLENGVQVFFVAGGHYNNGDYWLIPARTATAISRPLVEWPQDRATPPNPLPQPPAGIERHYCSLALLQFSNNTWTLLSDCRHRFPPLASSAIHVTNINWANDGVVAVDMFFSQGLRVTLDAPPDPKSITSSTVIVALEGPPAEGGDLATVLSQAYIILAEPTVSSNVISWKPPSLLEQLLSRNPPSAGRLRTRVTLKGHFIWAILAGPTLYLDGQVFVQPNETLFLPSGNGERASDFESWFWLVFPAVTVSPTDLNFFNQNVGHTSGSQAVTVTNHGSTAVALSITLAGANSADFAQTNKCGANLAAGKNCAISVLLPRSQSAQETRHCPSPLTARIPRCSAWP